MQAKKAVQIIILGDGAVGKTAILSQYHEKKFDEEHVMTLGLDYITKKYQGKDGNEYNVKIWDTAGQERFKTLTFSFYKKADGVIMAFDSTDQKSYDNIQNWADSIDKHAPNGVPKILVGNKIDLEGDRVISEQMGNDLADKFGLKFYQTSAKKNINITECMEDIIQQTIDFKFSPAQTAQQKQRKSVMLTKAGHNAQ